MKCAKRVRMKRIKRMKAVSRRARDHHRHLHCPPGAIRIMDNVAVCHFLVVLLLVHVVEARSKWFVVEALV
jgi:hypothetical protein